jgi:hypothetical protein
MVLARTEAIVAAQQFDRVRDSIASRNCHGAFIMPKTSVKFGLALVTFFAPLAVLFAMHSGAVMRSVPSLIIGSNGEAKCVQASPARADEQTESTHPDGVCWAPADLTDDPGA